MRVRRSAVITQYRGAGKSELMGAFAARDENENEVAGGVYWVVVDGEVTHVRRDLSI